MELRMYFFVPYNISPIQQAIQAGHAALEYAYKYKDDKDYLDFIVNHKTWIILNGGTTNSKLVKDPDTGWHANPRTDEAPYYGSLDNIAHQLIKNNIHYGLFEEPDLNNALTAVCFLADERVFNYKNYPDFVNWLLDVKMYEDSKEELQKKYPDICIRLKLYPHLQQEMFPEYYKEWVELMGGEKNLFLRELIRDKKLA